MIPKGRRLTRAAAKETARVSLRTLHGAYFSLAYAPATRLRATCVVSKKVATKATQRNLLKRRCRAVLSRALKEEVRPVSLFLRAKPGAALVPFLSLKEDIVKLLQKLP